MNPEPSNIEQAACPNCQFRVLIPVAFECPNCQVVIGKRLPERSEEDIVEVHNVWTVYGPDPHSVEADIGKPLAIGYRPQDWGDPRWLYHRFRFEWPTEDKLYINNAHCWTELRMEEYEYPTLFSGLIVQVLMPGSPPELCGRDFMAEDDLWLEEWGPQPPIWDPYEYYEEVVP